MSGLALGVVGDLLRVVSISLLVVVGLKVIAFLALALHHHRRIDVVTSPVLSGTPLVSIIVPCFNEAAGIENCIRSIEETFYPNIEVIIVDDGSTDETLEICQLMALQVSNLHILQQPNAGKAAALNRGLAVATGEIVVTVDADSAFRPNTLHYLVAPFDDPLVGAVGGNVKVANRKGLLDRQQALEYVSGLNLQRRAFAAIGCMQVISGAIGAFRRVDLTAIGGFSDDTIVEDMDVTVAMASAGRHVRFAGRAVAFTEAPIGLRDWAHQRYRWTFGGFQVLRKHRAILFQRSQGSIGTVGLPFFLAFPWIDVAVSLLLVAAVVLVVMGGSLAALLQFYVVLATLQVALALVAISLDGGESRRLALLAAFDSLWYSLLISSITIWAGTSFILGRTPRWTKLARFGKNRSVSVPHLLIPTDIRADDRSSEQPQVA
jgi:poly-beta-1,6 N-acetyl-D-glucosamine synthase